MRRDPFRGQDQRERKGPLSWRDVVSNCQELPNLPRASETCQEISKRFARATGGAAGSRQQDGRAGRTHQAARVACCSSGYFPFSGDAPGILRMI
jgi:hypothetical protein